MLLDLSVCSEGISYFTQNSVVIHQRRRGAEYLDTRVRRVSFVVGHSRGQLDLQHRIESVLPSVIDLRLYLQVFVAPHQVRVNPINKQTQRPLKYSQTDFLHFKTWETDESDEVTDDLTYFFVLMDKFGIQMLSLPHSF